jgi:hypothetical protein
MATTEPDQAAEDATALGAELQPTREANAEPDFVLATLVSVINSLPSMEFGVTLYVGGLIVSGLAVSGHSYFNLLHDKVVGDGTDANRTAFASIFKRAGEVYPQTHGDETDDDDEAGDKKPRPTTTYIHLRAATVHVVGSADTIEQDLWRGRLSQIDGWSMGNFGPKPPLQQVQEPAS